LELLLAGGIVLVIEKKESIKLDVSEKNIEKHITALKEAKPRKFTQTIEAGINISGINFKQTNNRIGFEVVLPHGFKKEPKTVLFGSTPNFIETLKSAFNKVITAEEIPNLDKKTLKHLAKEYDLFFAEPAALTIVGKFLGQTLAPRGKMPKPCPPNVQAVKVLTANFTKTVTVSNKKGNSLPVLHFPIGKEDMPIKDLAENFLTVYNKVLPLLPGNTQNLKSIYLKTTMSPAQYIFKR
jgi:large subunit ribosomal protein L1